MPHRYEQQVPSFIALPFCFDFKYTRASLLFFSPGGHGASGALAMKTIAVRKHWCQSLSQDAPLSPALRSICGRKSKKQDDFWLALDSFHFLSSRAIKLGIVSSCLAESLGEYREKCSFERWRRANIITLVPFFFSPLCDSCGRSECRCPPKKRKPKEERRGCQELPSLCQGRRRCPGLWPHISFESRHLVAGDQSSRGSYRLD